MALTPQLLAQVDSFEALAQLCFEELDWPAPTWSTFAGVADLYGTPTDSGVESILAVQQMSADQVWGIFLVDFGGNKLRRSQLRFILNRVAERERSSHAERTWAHEDILFICRSESSTWTLGHYSGEKTATAKLKTFGWNDPLSARTFRTRNFPHLKWREQHHWAKAWDAEALTDEFYKDYDQVFNLFLSATKHPREGDTKRLFVQSLFNRLMFLAFIEKMGWLSIDGDKDYLHRLFQRHKANPDSRAPTFYNVLEYLFFSGLNSVNGVCPGNNLQPLLGSVPYLNGGLFHRDPELDRSQISIPDNLFEEIFSDPLGLFRKYTFTVTESTPFDIDVAVDPEMLGKIFEELVTGRHESGSYYTPRPIVSFMCREALKGYLTERGIDPVKAELLVDDHNADELRHGEISDVLLLLNAIKVVDPACGSGAYLLGMLRELFDLIQIVERRRTEATPRELYNVKLDIIQNNLYGVDIDPFAVNIARLRMWLSLAVDHKGDQPEPLPNLDYKIEAGDSLTSPNPTGSLDHTNLFRDDRIREFERLKKEFGKPAVTKEEAERKDEIRKQIDTLRAEMSGWFGAKPPSRTKTFDWRVEFAEVFKDRHDPATIGGSLNLGFGAGKKGQAELAADPERGGFDVVLANPPYVRQEGIVQNMGADYKKALVANYPDTGSGTADLFVYFYDRGLQLLRPGGMFVYISSNKWFKAGYGAKLRMHFVESTSIQSITDFGDLAVFRNAMAYAMIFIARRTAVGDRNSQAPTFTAVPTLANPYPNVKEVITRFGHNLPLDAIIGEDWTLADAETLRKLRIMKQSGITLGEYVKGQIYYGIKTGFNEAFVIDGETRQRLIDEDPKSAEIIKPLAVGKDIRPWRIDSGNRWLIVTEIGVNMTRYPSIMAHLSSYEGQLTGRSDQGDEWWELRACAYYDQFEKPKIAYQEIATYQSFAWIEPGVFTNNKVFQIFDPPLWLLGLLQSKSAWEFYQAVSQKMAGGALAMQTPTVATLPVPELHPDDKTGLERLICRILFAKDTNPEADVSGLEAEIDDRVEFLYFHQAGGETYDQWKARLEAEAATEVGAIRTIMKSGEDEGTEFKSSVIWDTYQDKHNLVMRDEVLKEICAFLNAEGGTILCGVDDNGNLLGLAKDLKHSGNQDKLGLVVTNALGDLLKPNPVELVKMKFIDIDGETILRIDVQPDRHIRYESPSTKKEDANKNIPRTYVRQHGSAKALEGQDLINWWQRRSERDKE